MLMRTKKKAGITAGILAVAVLISAVFCLCFKTEQIDIEQIRSISVRLPDDVEILLSAEEAEQVKGSLAKVELRGIATGLFKDIAGGTYMQYHLYFYDGTEMYFGELWPYYVIDGERGYGFADEEICGDLRELYIELLEKYYVPYNER